ncbi:uncharacterized protein G2W53_000886 [Senna tora]|uniref:Uncharacterized protein n=1 Tax=Senna tora TaxID=362788 RepID=A0A834XHD4_9FABA|nr:uncharacterized protein G2W53_000886 [Senna tora]
MVNNIRTRRIKGYFEDRTPGQVTQKVPWVSMMRVWWVCTLEHEFGLLRRTWIMARSS